MFICSPFILICIGLVLGTVIDSVRFKTSEEIVNVTGLEDFPEFSYITNDDADWTGVGVYVYQRQLNIHTVEVQSG